MDLGVLVVLVGGLIFVAHFFAWLFSHTKIPDALLLMLLGLLVGPIFGWLKPDFFGQAGDLAVSLVLVILLFQSGLGLRWSVLKAAWRGTVGLSVISFVTMLLGVGLVLWWLFGFAPVVAFMIAAMLGGTSSAVVIPLLQQLTMDSKSRTMLTLESVVSDVLAIVLTFALLEAYEIGVFSTSSVASYLFMSFLGAAMIGVSMALIWSRLLSSVRNMKNSMFTTPALVLIVYGFVEQLGWSGPIAALAFGIMMGNIVGVNMWLNKRSALLRYAICLSSLSKRENAAFREAVFLLQTFFFVFVGLSIRLNSVVLLMAGLSLAGLMLLLRLGVVRWLMPLAVAPRDKAVMSIMIPKGLAAAALAALPLQRGVLEGGVIQEIVYSVILFSVLITSVMIFVIYRQGKGAVSERA